MKHIASNPREGIFSPTSLEVATCLRKYYFEKGIGLLPRGDNIHFIYGSAIHAAIASFHKAENCSYEEAKIQAIKTFVQEWALSNIQGTEKKNREIGIYSLQGYFEFYKNDSAKYKYVESPFSVQMPNGTMLIGVIDKAWIIGKDSLIVDDTKTTGSSLTPWFWNKFKNSFQLSAYWYAAESLWGDVTNIRIDAIRTPFNGKPEDCFQRKQFDRTEVQMSEWLNSYCRKTDYIIENIENIEAMWQEQTQCDAYGGCPYIDVCMHGPTHPNVPLLFEIKKKGE